MQFVQRLIKTALLVGLVTGSMYAQDQSTILRPILGFTVDRTGASISPILGVAGASILDQNFDFGIEVRNAVISVDHDYALVERADDAKIILSKLRENVFPLELPGLHTGPSLIAISPSGTAAAFLNRTTGFLQTFRGMPDSAEMVYEFDTSVVPGERTALAVNDDGNIALIKSADADAGSNTAWVTFANGALWAIPSANVSSIAFLPRRSDAIVADAGTQEVFLVSDLNGAANRIPLISLNRAAGIPADVATSQDGRLVFVVSAGSQEVTIVDVDTHISTVVDCSCSPTRPERLKGNAIFLLDRPPADLLHVLDLSGSEPRVLVIPVKPNTVQFEGPVEQ
jgi:DNA-binding beta-propeller fold protein YncE